jgi:S1-C subfamily serine protease
MSSASGGKVGKTLRIAALALLAGLFSPAGFAVDWLVIGDLGSYSETYALDVDSIDTAGGRNLRVWTKRLLAKPESRGPFQPAVTESVERLYIDCTAKAYSVVSSVNRDENGRALDQKDFPDPPVSLRPASPGTIGEDLGRTACEYAFGKRPASRRSVDPRKFSGASWVKLSVSDDRRFSASMSDADVSNAVAASSPALRDFIFYLGRYDYAEPDTFRGMRYSTVITLYIGSCKLRTNTNLSSAWFDKNGIQILRMDRDLAGVTQNDVRVVRAGTIGDTMLTRACRVALARGEAPVQTSREGEDVATRGEPPAQRGDGAQGGQGKKSDASSMSTGTGWHVGGGLIVTAAHVVDGAGAVRIVGPGEKLITANVVQFDAKNDVAVLSVGPGYNLKSVALARAPAPLGSHVLTIGYPLLSAMGTSHKVTSGEISATQGMQNDPTLYQISAPIQSGNSGGPLFNMNGEVVGMVVSKLRAEQILKTSGDLPQNVNYAVKTRYIEALLEEANRGPLPATPPQRKELRAEDLVAQARDAVFIILAVSKPEK